MFSLLSNYVLSKGGIVIAAGFDSRFNVCHVAITDESELSKLKGSKYVQSYVDPQVYKTIKDALNEDQLVLFVGTPCETEGVINYVGYNDNLIAVDVLCHGVPSPLMWQKYLSFRREVDGKGEIRNVSFRDKADGWASYSLKIEYENGIYIMNMKDDIYLKGFIRNVFLRPSCYSCKFKGIHRRTDITLGDFWDISKFSDSFDMSGVSLVLTHTGKGRKFVSELANNAKIEKIREYSKIYNGGLYKSAYYNLSRKSVFKNAERYDFSELYKRYFGERFITRVERAIARKFL